jgi:hypothetical protein
MIKYFPTGYDNEDQDTIAFEHGVAFSLDFLDDDTMKSNHAIATTIEEVRQLQAQGWRHRWTLRLSDIYPGGL